MRGTVKTAVSFLLAILLLLGTLGCQEGGKGSGTETVGQTGGITETTSDPNGDTDDMKTVYYVSPDADKASADGSAEKPFADIGSALSATSSLIKAAKEDSPANIKIVLKDGTHFIEKTVGIALTNDKASQYASLEIVPDEGAKPIISGAQSLDVSGFTKVDGQDYYLYQFEKDEDGKYPVFQDLYVDGQRADISKSETYKTLEDIIYTTAEEQKGMYISSELASILPDDLAGAQYFITAEWEFYILHADSIDRNDTKTYQGNEYVLLRLDSAQLDTWIKRHHSYIHMNDRNYYIQNHPVFINEGNEFAYDSETGRLWYRPADGKDISELDISYSVTQSLLRFQRLHNVTVSGITFTGTTCTHTAEKGYFAQQANGEATEGLLKAAAICIIGCENVNISGCNFEGLGTNGVMFRERTENLSVTDCDFKNIAMSAIMVGELNWVWSETGNANINVELKNNYIEHTGFEYPAAVALFVGLVKDAKILNNTIKNVAYSGMSIGWGWGNAEFKYGESYCVNNVEVAYNYIENFMQVGRDGGAIYILGSSAEESYREYFNYLHDNYAYIENGSMGQLAYYLDEATANWHVYDNVAIGTPRSLYLQHVAGTPVRNILAERLYADQYTPGGNANSARNVVVKDIFLAEADKLFDTYPEAKAIADASGCKRD